MAKIDPNDAKWTEGAPSGDRPKPVGPGKKLLAAVGFERYFSRNGNPMLSIRFVCLLDREGSGDEKGEIYENFTLSDRALWRFVAFAQALGYPEAFDPEDDEDVSRLLTHAYVEGEVRMDEWQGKERPKIDRFARAGRYEEDPDWASWIEAGEERHRGYLEWREKNPRGSGGYGSSRSSTPSTSSSSAESYPVSDIPF
jgi:hypothetical protein